jgi:ABC-2 type transport system permease protein
MFMTTTRKIDPDSLINTFVAAGVIIYSAAQLGLQPSAGDIALYLLMILCGLLIHYSALTLTVALAFWITNAQGLEGSYFTLFEFSRIPRQAFTGVANVIFVWFLPAVIVSNVPAHTLLHGFDLISALWLLAATIAWFSLACFVFHRGLRRYSSASS